MPKDPLPREPNKTRSGEVDGIDLEMIAHQFNNILMGIQGNTSLLLLGKGAENPECVKLREIDGLVKRGVELTRALRDHGGSVKAAIEPTAPLEPETGGESEKPSAMLSGSETILIADDEEMILTVCGKMLGVLGYNVLSARSGSEAVDIFNNRTDTIDLVMLDIVMPDMGGGEAYYRIKEINPDIRVLLLSKYEIGGEAADLVDQGGDSFLHKPFNIEELSRKVRDVLDH